MNLKKNEPTTVKMNETSVFEVSYVGKRLFQKDIEILSEKILFDFLVFALT